MAQPSDAACTMLHIVDLDPTATEADILSAFKNFASVIRFVKVRRKTGCLSSANIQFDSPEAAQSARNEVNGELIKNSHVTITYFNSKYKKDPNATVFLSNFPTNVTNRDLESEFSACGCIISAKVVHDKAGNSLRYGFIQFDSAETAAAAIVARNRQEWRGEELKVEPFIPCEQRESGQVKSNLYVLGFSAATSKAEFDALFSTFGAIKSSVIQYTSKAKYCGFVDFIEASSAEAAIAALHGQTALGGLLSIHPHMSKGKRAQFLRSQYAQKQEEWKRTNLVFTHLPHTVTENNLREVCQQYGPIISLKIPSKRQAFHIKERKAVKETKNVGFVNFETMESAESAQKALNLMTIDQQSVLVSHWKPRLEYQSRRKTPKTTPPAASLPVQPLISPLPESQPSTLSVPQPIAASLATQPARGSYLTAAYRHAVATRLMKLKVDKLPEEKSKKQGLGDFIYPYVMRMSNSTIAGKVTGMLLELPIPQLLHLAENLFLLRRRVSEAIEVLKTAWSVDEKMRSSLDLLKQKDA